MNISQQDQEKLKQLFKNINTFSSQQMGVVSGNTTTFETVLIRLRKSAAELAKAVDEGVVTNDYIDALESDLMGAVTISPSGFLSGYDSPNINPEEIDGVIDFLDSLREKIDWLQV